MKQQQAAIEPVEDELVLGCLVARIDRAPDGAGARNPEYATESERIVSGQDRNFLAGGDARSFKRARDPVTQLLDLAVAEVASVHGQARRIGAERSALVEVIDETHGRPQH